MAMDQQPTLLEYTTAFTRRRNEALLLWKRHQSDRSDRKALKTYAASMRLCNWLKKKISTSFAHGQSQ